MDFFDGFMVLAITVYFGAAITRFLQMRAQGISPVTLISKENKRQSLLDFLFFLVLLFWITQILFKAFHWQINLLPESVIRIFFNTPFSKILGVAFITLGFFFLIWGLISFGKSWRIGIDKENPGALVTTGAFALSRNPIYLFLNSFFWGTFLIDDNALFFIFALCASVGIHFRILKEEKFLTSQYDEEYKIYQKNVRRYL